MRSVEPRQNENFDHPPTTTNDPRFCHNKNINKIEYAKYFQNGTKSTSLGHSNHGQSASKTQYPATRQAPQGGRPLVRQFSRPPCQNTSISGKIVEESLTFQAFAALVTKQNSASHTYSTNLGTSAPESNSLGVRSTNICYKIAWQWRDLMCTPGLPYIYMVTWVNTECRAASK